MNRSLTALVLVAVLSPLAARPASGQEVGKVAALTDVVERGRQGDWQKLELGGGVSAGDAVRTDDEGRVRLVFADGSVVVVSPRSEIVIDENVYDPSQGTASSMFDLLKGKIRAVVSDYYETTGSFEVKTPNSISGVRGTDFIVVHDPALEVSEVVGVSGRVSVSSVAAPGVAVEVTSKTLSRIEAGQAPSQPTTLSEERFRYYLDDLEFIGQDAPESVLFNDPALIDDAVPEPERAPQRERAAAAELDVDHIPTEVDEVYPNAAGVAGQPADAVDSGDLGIRF
jgi:hypothetical protein